MSARVEWISVAPVKGLGLVQLSAVELGWSGAAANRVFYLVDQDGRMVNGKRLGALATVVPAYDPALMTLSLRFPDGSEVAGEVVRGQEVTTSFFGRPVLGHAVEGPWSEALSSYFGRRLSLVKVAHEGEGVDRGAKATVSVLSTASLARLAEALGAREGLDPRRFRMLFGVSGVAAHAEDTWVGRRARFGEAVVAIGGLAGRCLVTSQDPGTGEPDLDTLGALRSYRRGPEGAEKFPFGVWGAVVQPGRVALGDTVAPF